MSKTVWTKKCPLRLGTTYEMGGTWVSHVHGRLFGEMMRYGLKDEVTMTRTQGGGAEYFTLDTGA